jgi:hypothetical protein
VPNNAPLVVLTFLGTCFLLGLLGLAFVWTLAAGRRPLAVKVLVAGLVVGGLYSGILLTSSMKVVEVERLQAIGEALFFQQALGVHGHQLREQKQHADAFVRIRHGCKRLFMSTRP